MAIDWEYQTTCYNRNNKTKYSSPKTMLESLYEKHGSCCRVAIKLLLAGNSVWTKMKAEKIILNPKGWNRTPLCEVAIAKIEPARIKNMQAKEIAAEIGFSENYTRAVLERMDIAYKKRWAKKS